MSIKIYNTLKREKEEFRPIKEGKIGMYVCGPTVYDVPHIGHARSAYVFDVIRRYFIYRGYEVRFVRNVTDVDDKIINKAKEEFKDEDIASAVKKVSVKYLNIYHESMSALGIMPPDEEPKATKYIEKMKDSISGLIENGVAYESGGDVYFDVKKARDYGKLSNQSFDMLEAGARISPGDNKKDPLDFALWKSAKEGDISWDSPWGQGRPGWHIECSVMSSDMLGDEFDIHGGGIDLIFPHHENELTQSEGAGKKFARYWIHNGLLTIDKEKMAKSLGNFVTIEEVLSKYPADVLKILFLQTHYSHPVDFSWEKMEEAKKAWERFVILLEKLNGVKGQGSRVKDSAKIDSFKDRFKEAMDDDFNMPGALAVLFDMVTYVNKRLSDASLKLVSDLKYGKDTLLELADVLSLNIQVGKTGLTDNISMLIKKRDEARRRKDFEESDKIRRELEERGIILEDTKGGTTWRRKI